MTRGLLALLSWQETQPAAAMDKACFFKESSGHFWLSDCCSEVKVLVLAKIIQSLNSG